MGIGEETCRRRDRQSDGQGSEGEPEVRVRSADRGGGWGRSLSRQTQLHKEDKAAGGEDGKGNEQDQHACYAGISLRWLR